MGVKMLRRGTPVEDYQKAYGLWVKREDLACPGGPNFSKTRGVFKRVQSRPETIIGALDTYHSQAGHAVAKACKLLGKRCIDYYPEYKYEPGPRRPQLRAQALGADLVGLPAGRSAILYHAAKKHCESFGGYMMPNALKLEESVDETANETANVPSSVRNVIIPASSGTIAAGVIKGLGTGYHYIIHLGYSRSHEEVLRYLHEKSGHTGLSLEIVDERYAYKDKARGGPTPPWPCNEYYDLKAFRWWVANRKMYFVPTLFWNIG